MPHSKVHVLTDVESSALTKDGVELAYKLSSLRIRSQHVPSKSFLEGRGRGLLNSITTSISEAERLPSKNYFSFQFHKFEICGVF